MLKWFSLSGIFTEIKRIRWPKQNELFRLTSIVIIFIIFFGVFFVASEALVALFLKMIGIGA